MSKKFLRILLLGSIGMFTHGNGVSADIVIDAVAEVDIETRSGRTLSLSAYRSADDCNSWLWLPPSLEASDSLLTMHGVVPVRVNQEGRPRIAYASHYRSSFFPVEIGDGKFQELKEKAAEIVRSLKAQGRSDFAFCNSEIQASGIRLSPMMLQGPITSLSNTEEESQVRLVGVGARANERNTYYDIRNGVSASFRVDATDPNIEPNFFRRISQGVPGIYLGSIAGSAIASIPPMAASLTVRGVMSANVVSELKQLYEECSKERSEGSGLFSFGFGLFSRSSRTCTSRSELITALRGCTGEDCSAAVRQEFTFNFDIENFVDSNGQNIDQAQVPVCLNNNCEQIERLTRRQYMQSMLFTLWMMSNFSETQAGMLAPIVNPTRGTNGEIRYEFSGSFSLRERIRHRINLPAIPLQVSKINAFGQGPEGVIQRSPALRCARDQFEASESPEIFEGLRLVPFSCVQQ